MKLFRILFPKVDISLNSLKDYLLSINIFSGMLIGFTVSIFELILILIWTFTRIGTPIKSIYYHYLVLYIVLLIFSILGYLYLRLNKSNIEKHKTGIKILLYSYCTFIVLWGIAISSLDLYRGRQFSNMTFLICYMVVMCGIVMDRKYSYIMSLLTLAISIPVFSSLIYGKIYFSFGLVFNHLNAVVVCLVISYVNYNQRQRYFKLLVEKNLENKKLEEENNNLAYFALNDELTGLKNRFAFAEDKEKFYKENKNYSKYVLVCLIDIDDFKKINDKYGHLFGDECLKEVGKLLNSWSNYSYRYGGEEFICAFKLDSIENIDKILAELNSEVSCIRIKDVPNFRLTVSIGAYAFKPKNHESYDNCFEIMDENLYKVKKTGKNNYKYTIEDK